jgi:hypothetical protein
VQIPPELEHLTRLIATERTRPAMLQTVAELNKDVGRVLASGQDVEAVQGWLRGLLAQAVAAQR